MRKNYILALLATGVLPLSAFAAIDIPGVATNMGSWDLSGVSHAEDEAGIITVPGSQGGYPACTLENLPAGSYEITGYLENAELIVLSNDVEVPVVDNKFETTEESNIVIEVKAINKDAEYKFGNVTLALDVDLEAIQNDLNGMMPGFALTAPNEFVPDYVTVEVNGPEVVEEYNGLVETQAELQAAIDAVYVAGATPEEQMDAYKTYVASDLKSRIEEFATDANAYENGVKEDEEWVKYPIADINEWAKQLPINIVNHNNDLSKINSKVAENPGWDKQIKDLEALIEGSGLTDELATEIAAVDTALADAIEAITTNWNAEGVQLGKAVYETVDMDPIKDAFNALKNAYSKLLSDEDRYNNLWLPDYEKLTNAYINAQQVIKDLYKDEPGRKERQDSVMLAVTAIYNDAVNSLQVKLGDGFCTKDQFDNDDPIIEQAIADLQARVEEDGVNLQNERDAKALAYDKIADLGTALDEIDIHEDAYKKADLDGMDEALRARIEALREGIDAIYASTTVLTEGYVEGTPDPSEFSEAVEALQADIEAFAAQVDVANRLGALTTDLNAARDEISADENNQYLLGLPKDRLKDYRVDVVDIMNGSYESITEAIKQQQGIYDAAADGYKNVTDTALDNIKTSINGADDSYLTNGLQMAKDFADAYKIAIPALEDAEALYDLIENTQLAFDVAITSSIEGRGGEWNNDVAKTPYSTQAQAYLTKAQEIIRTLQDARFLAPQNAFVAVEGVMTDADFLALPTEIPATKLAYVHVVEGPEQGNIYELDQATAYLDTEMAEVATYAGYDVVEELYNAAADALAEVKTAFEAALTAEDSDAIIALNPSAKTVIAQLQAVQNEIDKVVLNHKSYVRVCDIVGEIEGRQAACNTYADEKSYEPARTSWKELVQQKVEEAQALRDGEVLDTYNDVEMLAKVEGKTNEEIFTEQLNEIIAWFDAYEAAVDRNELAHNLLLDESGSITSLVDEVNTVVEAAEVPIILEDGQDAAVVLRGLMDELSALDTELYNVYKALTCPGQELAGSEEDQTLMYKYEQLRKKINDLKAELDDDYAKALKEANEKFIADNWAGIRSDMMDVFTKAIENLDALKAAVKAACKEMAENPDIQEGVDHQPIYLYAPDIQDLIDDVIELFDKSWPSKINGEPNADQHKLTMDDLQPFIDRADEIIAGIDEKYTAKVEKVKTTAVGLLSDKVTEVHQLITDVETELRAAGCDEESIYDLLNPITKKVEAAEEYAHEPLDGTLTPAELTEIALAYHSIENVTVTDAQKVAAAQSTFNHAVSAKEAELADVQDTLDNSNLSPSRKAEYQNRIDAATDELNSYRNDEITLENLQEELDKVNGIDVAKIQADLDQEIADNVANAANKAVLDEAVEGLWDKFDGLNDWVEKLLVANEVPLTTLSAQITAVQGMINDAYDAGNLKDTTSEEYTAIEAQISAVEDAIDATYKDAYSKELDRLQNEELYETERAFNEAAKAYEEETGLTDYPDTTEGRAYRERIDNQMLALGVAAGVTDVPDEDQQQYILGIQDELLNIQIELGYQTVDTVIASLNEKAEDLIAAINAGIANLGNYAAEEYTDDFEALIEKVEAVQAEWNENKASVIVQEGIYKDKLAEIQSDLEALEAEAAAYQAQQEQVAEDHAASDAAYEDLNGDLEEVRAAYEAAATNAGTYADRLEDAHLNLDAIEANIADAQAYLDEAKADYACVDYAWPEGLTPDDLTAAINEANRKLWSTVTTSYQAEAQQAISNCRAALNDTDKQHSNPEALLAAVNALDAKLYKLSVVTNGNAEAGQAFVDAAKQIIANAEALFKDIVDSQFIPGDITGTGEVTNSDYEALIDLLGEIDDPKDFDNPAYDVNGDGQVTAADVAAIIDLIMKINSDSAVQARMPMISNNNAIYVVKTSTNNGISRYALVLNNSADFFCAQMDIVLSNGMEIVNEGVAERTSDNEFYGSTTRSGKHRVILSSINKNTFVGSEGAIVYIDVLGDGELSLENVYAVDLQGRMYNINVMTNVTGIESISTDGKNADIFNVAGQKMNRVQRGAVNIIRTADGKTTKILNK